MPALPGTWTPTPDSRGPEIAEESRHHLPLADVLRHNPAESFAVRVGDYGPGRAGTRTDCWTGLGSAQGLQ